MRLGVCSCALGVLLLFMCYVWLACGCLGGFRCALTSVMYCMYGPVCSSDWKSHTYLT